MKKVFHIPHYIVQICQGKVAVTAPFAHSARRLQYPKETNKSSHELWVGLKVSLYWHLFCHLVTIKMLIMPWFIFYECCYCFVKIADLKHSSVILTQTICFQELGEQ